VITDDREIVSAIRANLATRVGKDRYEVWFGPTTELAVRGESLVISVPSQFFYFWLRSHFRKDLEASAVEAFGKPLALEFRIAAAVAEASAAQLGISDHPSAAVIQPAAAPVLNANAPALSVVSQPVNSSAATAEAARPRGDSNSDRRPAAAPGREDEQHETAPTIRRRFASFDQFVVGTTNALAHQAAKMAAERPGFYSPLFVHGPTASGKTHLLESILTAFRQSHPRARCVYLSAEQFTSQFLEALRGSGMPNFRRKYRDLELLAIDDVQFFRNKQATIAELQFTIDTLMRGGRQLVLAADCPPAAIKSLGPEMMSRLSGGMICRIEAADYTTRLGIVQQHAITLGMELPADVGAFIASHFTSQSRELGGALKRLQATSVAHRRAITVSLAEECLAELIDHGGRIVKLPDIERAVCEVFGLDPESLHSTRKAKTVSHPRMLAMWLARKHTRAGYSEIGSFFGRRSHSTAISAQKKVEDWMRQGPTLRVSTGTLSLEETIRRVEENLRAG